MYDQGAKRAIIAGVGASADVGIPHVGKGRIQAERAWYVQLEGNTRWVRNVGSGTYRFVME